jgi:two-component system, OmpR family, response regulator
MSNAPLSAGTAVGLDTDPDRILVVDDEDAIRQLVAVTLRYEGFTVQAVGDGNAALRAVEKGAPALVLLDVMLPDIDGFEVQRVLREHHVPVIFLTARDSPTDTVRGLTLGADDYVTKPFALDELVARVRAVLRRANPGAAPNRPLAYADLRLDHERHEVHRSEAVVDLTPTEFNLLRFFMENPERVLSKAQILDHVWKYDFGGDANIVETYVSYLRRKIGDGRAELIRTVRGVGYVLRA